MAIFVIWFHYMVDLMHHVSPDGRVKKKAVTMW